MATEAWAQNTQKISGRVTDDAGQPVIGAAVMVKGTSTGTVTDVDGRYVLDAPENAEIEVSFIGYDIAVQSASGQETLDFVLNEEDTQLDELIVIGYGSVKKGTLTSAVSKMDDKAIKDRPLARAEQALQGQLAGVTVRTITGEPGADQTIRVRGAASINASSDPLYVVDGVPMDNINSINPNDIQSIEVLKDAASAAIYGSRGSNGVVIVSTKRGKTGKPMVVMNANVGFQTPEKLLDLMTAEEWMAFRVRWNDQNYLNLAKQNGVSDASISDDSATRMQKIGGSIDKPNYQVINDDRWFQYLSPEMQAQHTYAKDKGELALLDWQDKVFRHAPVQSYDMNITGGTENVNYLMSAGFMKQDGIVTGTDYRRITLRANVDAEINKYIGVAMSLAPTYITTNNAGAANGKDSRIHHVLSSTPVSEPEVGYMTNVQPYMKYNWAGSPSSPWYLLKTNTNESNRLRLLTNTAVRIMPIEGMKIEMSAAVNYYDVDQKSYTYTSTSANWTKGEGSQSSGGHSTERKWQTLLQAVLNYDKTIGEDHTIGFMAGASREKQNVGHNTNQTYKAPFANDVVTESFNGNIVTPNANTVTQATPKSLASFFGRLQYDYASKYMVSGSVRWDGCSVFGDDNKWGVFPAVSAGWMISNEDFFKDRDLYWWNTLKIRASYGVTGNNNISNTAAYNALTSTTYAGTAGYNAKSPGNSDLGWEKTHSTDVALDLGFVENRFQLSVDYYTKRTKDLLYEVPVAGASGFTKVWGNSGEIKNNGVDIEVNTINLSSARQLKWSTQFNASYNKSEVMSIGTDDAPIHSGWNGQGDGANASNILEVGQPVNVFYMYDAIGVWRTQAELDAYAAECGVENVTFQGKVNKPGDIRYEDVNHDGNIDLDNDRKYLGQPQPKWTFGLTNTFEWKNWDASILVTAQTGGMIFGCIGRAIDRPSMGALSNVMDCWNNAWWSEEEQGDGKTPYIFSSTTGGQVDSRWLWKSDYLCLKNITIGYTIPLKVEAIKKARAYVSCENLLRIDDYYSGYSPEAANAGGSNPGGAASTGIDYGGYPTARIMSLGVNITF